jgi:hypothetical protein
MKTAKVRVSTDRNRIWSCARIRKANPQLVNRKPAATLGGKFLTVFAPPLSRNEMFARGYKNLCQARRFWLVPDKTSKPISGQKGTWVCEHQVEPIALELVL